MTRQYIRSNSILVAADLGGDRGFAFVGLNDSVGISVSTSRNRAEQVGSSKLAANHLSFAPDINFSLSFVPTRHFAVENLFGLNFNFNPTFTSLFEGRSEQFCNVYLFISEKQSYDFIKQIQDAQSLNGVECIAFGNCYLTRYGLSMRAGDLARSELELVASNMEASFVANNQVKKPTVDFETGLITSDILQLDWPQVNLSLQELTKEAQPILPTTEVQFSCVIDDLEVPGAVLSPLKDAKIQSLDLDVSINRETVYGFGSDFPRGRKIKYPVECGLALTTIVSDLSSGVFSGWLHNEARYNADIRFIDPTEVFLSGKSFAELSGFYNTGVSGATGFFTNNRCLRLQSGRLESYGQSAAIGDFMQANLSMQFQCDEQDGIQHRYGLNDGSQPYHFYTPEAQKLFDVSGNLLAGDNFLYITSGNSQNHVIDGDGNLLLCDNYKESENLVGLLDGYESGLQVAILPFRGFTSYTGNWCSIRETGSNTIVNIGFNADGRVDENAFNMHVNGGSGFINAYYSQDPSNRNANAVSATQEPLAYFHEDHGYPVIRLDGIDDFMSSSILTASARSIYFVAKKRSPKGPSALNRKDIGGCGAGSLFLADIGNTDGSDQTWAYRGIGIATVFSVGGDVNEWTVLTSVLDSITIGKVYANNTPSASNPFDPINGGVTSTIFNIGNAIDFCADADISAALVYNVAHDNTTRQAIQSILASQFGITLS